MSRSTPPSRPSRSATINTRPPTVSGVYDQLANAGVAAARAGDYQQRVRAESGILKTGNSCSIVGRGIGVRGDDDGPLRKLAPPALSGGHRIDERNRYHVVRIQ